MLCEKEKEVESMKEMLLEKEDKLETLLKQAAKVLAANTNYTTMITGPQYRSKKVKLIQLSEVDEAQLLAVIVYNVAHLLQIRHLIADGSGA